MIREKIHSQYVFSYCARAKTAYQVHYVGAVNDVLSETLPPLDQHAAVGLDNLDAVVLMGIVTRCDHHTASAYLLSADGYDEAAAEHDPLKN